MICRKKILNTAIAASMGTGAPVVNAQASAAVVEMSWSGLFIVLDPNGAPFNNTAPFIQDDGYYGWRSAVSGTMTLDTTTGSGTGTFNSFSFASNGFAAVSAVTIQTIVNGASGAGSLMLGNMVYNWGGDNNVPISIVWDAAGMLAALNSGTCGPGCAITGGAIPASNNTVFGFGRFTYTLPIGGTPMATTTWNTTDIGAVTLGTNPSGTLPLIADTVISTRCDTTEGPFICTGIGGSPLKAGPFQGWNLNFDILSMQVTSAVPIPPALWLFGSGLLGLTSVMRRKRSSASRY